MDAFGPNDPLITARELRGTVMAAALRLRAMCRMCSMAPVLLPLISMWLLPPRSTFPELRTDVVGSLLPGVIDAPLLVTIAIGLDLPTMRLLASRSQTPLTLMAIPVVLPLPRRKNLSSREVSAVMA